MHTKEVKFIYLDIGGVVILDFSQTNKLHELACAIGVTANNFDAFKKLFAQFEPSICIGKRNLFDFTKKAKELLNLDIQDNHDMLGEFVNRFEKNQSIHNALNKLRSKFKLGLLTNMYPNMLKRIGTKGILPRVEWDVVIDSSVVGLRKPQNEIYKLAESKAKVNPENILFIENSTSNIEAAKQLGWQTLLYNPSNTEESNKKIYNLILCTE